MDLSRRWTRRDIDPRARDIAVVLVCLAFTVAAVKAHWSQLPWPVIIGAGVVGSLAQGWRRQWRHLATVTGAAAYALSGNPVPLLVGLYTGVSYAPRRHVWAPAVAGWAGFAGWSWIDDGRLTASAALSAAVLAALVAALGLYGATRRALTASWRERAESAEAERRLREEQARSDERTRIAREMHDVLAHNVSLIALHAGVLELTSKGSSAAVQEGAALIRVTARETLQELRYVLGVLRTEPDTTAADRDAPFADLTALVRALTQAGQRVELHDRVGALPPVMAGVVYRIAQEGLTNARKHAPGASATVSVERADDGAVIVTVDNTAATDPPVDLPGSGSGLVGLAERVRLVGGTLHSGPLGEDGWRLRAALAWCDYGVGQRDAVARTPTADAP